MCLIIQTQKTKPLSKELLAHMQEQNGDGWGIMYIKNNHIRTTKSSTSENLWETYQQLKEYEPIIHLRWRTHGDINHDNTHPFYCGYGIYLMHNGIVNIEQKEDDKSDTWHLVEHWLKPLFIKTKNPHEIIRNKDFKKEFEKYIGKQNRIVLGDRGGYIFFNQKNWHEITNEKTGIAGTLVSNTYAWDAYGYGHPKPVFSDWRTKYKQPEKRKHTNGTILTIENNLIKSINSFFTNPAGYQELWPDESYDSRVKQLPKLLAKINNDAYLDIFVNTYKDATESDFETLVYITPEKAVLLLTELTRRLNV